MMKKKVWTASLLNLGILTVLAAVFFLVLPVTVQKSLSPALYGLAAVCGLIIGNLGAKVIILNRKLQAEKESIANSKEELQKYISNVVHDLRSPMASINMISELLEMELSDIGKENKDLISSIRKTSDGMLDRICCIIDNTKSDLSAPFENMVASNPYKVISEVISKHHILSIEKNIEIINRIPRILPEVYFNEEALDSVLSNLISNAIKYSNKRSMVELTCKSAEGKITFSVKDQGLGMNKEDLKKVFGRFAKLSARPTGGEDSSGLGLSIVKDLVEKMGGSVAVQSDGKGKGSTFSFTLYTDSNPKRQSA